MYIFLINLRINKWELTSKKKACVISNPWKNVRLMLIFTHVLLQRGCISNIHFRIYGTKTVENDQQWC